MILKLYLPIIFLFAAIILSVGKAENKDALNVEEEWKQSAGTPRERDPDWIEGVQKYHKDIVESVDSFPSEVSDEANCVKSTLKTLVLKVVELTNSESKILSAGADGILKAFNKVKIDDQSAQGIINEFRRVLPILMTDYRQLVTDLTYIIGDELVCDVNKAISDAESAFRTYMKQFNKGDILGRKKEVDYKPVMKSVQTLTNKISQMGEATLDKSDLATPEVQDSLVVLNLILNHIVICTHGLSSSSEAVLIQQKCEPVEIQLCVNTTLFLARELTESIEVNTVPNAENVPAHLQNLVNLSRKLNATLRKVFGLVNHDVAPTALKVTQQMLRSVKGVTSGLIKSLSQIG